MSDATPRLTIATQRAGCQTSVTAGAPWPRATWQVPGFSVATEGRVLVEARGEAQHGTLTFFAGRSVGGALLSSVERDANFIAGDRLLASAKGGFLASSGRGVTMLAGLGAFGGVRKKIEPLDKSVPIHPIGATDEVRTTDEVDAFVEGMDLMTEAWAGFDIASTALVGIGELARWALGVTGPVGAGHTALTLIGLRAVTHGLGTVSTAARVSGEDVPGLHLYALGSVNLATPLALTAYGGAGMIGTAFYNFHCALVDAHVIGGLGVSVKSLGFSCAQGMVVEKSAVGPVELGATVGTTTLQGGKVLLGGLVGTTPAQLPTLDLAVEALAKVALTAPTVTLTSGGSLEVAGEAVQIDAGASIVIETPACRLSISATGEVLLDVSSTMAVSVGARTVALGSGTLASAQLDPIAGSVLVGSPICGIEVDATGYWTFDAPVIQWS